MRTCKECHWNLDRRKIESHCGMKDGKAGIVTIKRTDRACKFFYKAKGIK